MRFEGAREEVLATCRTLVERGFLAGTGGNVALRADEEHLAVTPSATDYSTMSPEDICVVRLTDLRQVEGHSAPSVESGLHARLLRARPACAASVHTHQPVASAYTLLGRALQVVSADHRGLLGEAVPCAGYAPSGTRWLSWKVARALGREGTACLMRSHGAVCVAETAALALDRVEALESACARFFADEISGRDVLPAAVTARLLETVGSRLPRGER